MPNPNIPEFHPAPEAASPESSTDQTGSEDNASFDAILRQYEQSHSRQGGEGMQQRQGTVIAVSAEQVFLDIGYKSEGTLPLAAFSGNEQVKPGDTFPVTVKGRDAEGYYALSRFKIAQPKDWSSLEQAFTGKAIIGGMVTGLVKGGLSVDVGVRAFMPSSRSGARDAAAMEALVGQEIRCRILELDPAEEDVVVDRRAVLEEEERSIKERRYTEVSEGEMVHGTVRSFTDYGAFVDIGGVDALLHVGDISWTRVGKPADALSMGQQIEARVLKVDPEKRRISIGMKQLLPNPWDAVPQKYQTGERVHGTVTRVADFGAFVELEPGIEGLIHLSEMSWTKKARKPGDVVKAGDRVEAVVLGVNGAERRISLGLKQALGDPWAELSQRLRPGSVVEGPVTSFTKFGAFVQVSEGVEGMVHISEISAEKHIHHPQDVLKLGQTVKAQVLEVDQAKRQLRLSIKQLVPVSLDEYLAEHAEGDAVTGRLIEIAGGIARVELGEGIQGTCLATGKVEAAAQPETERQANLSALSSMLTAHWKGGPVNQAPKPEPLRAGQVRGFRIVKLDRMAKTIELETT